jgi:hypothetical protein
MLREKRGLADLTYSQLWHIMKLMH